MPQLLLKDWKPGLKKISTVTLLRQRTDLDLPSAKQCVDTLLKHESVSLAMASVEEATELARELSALGVICEVDGENDVEG